MPDRPPRPKSSLALLALLLLVPAIAAIGLTRARPDRRPVQAAETATAAAVVEERPPVEAVRPVLRGRILGADGNPVDGAAVRVLSAGPPVTVAAETASEGDGRFSFAHLGVDRARVEADHGADGTVTSAEIRLVEGETAEITLVLSDAGAVRGTVVDGDDHPVEGAALSLEGIPWTVPGATSDAQGAFRLAAVPGGATSLVAVARGYRSARVTLPRRQDSEDIVVRVRLTSGAPVDGEVHDPDDNPVKARVVACEGRADEASVVTGDDGTFQLPPSAIGCTAVARHDEYEASDPVVLREGGHARLRLKAGGAIEGVVVDERGAPVSSYTVGVESFVGAAGHVVRSGAPRKVEDPRGAFRLEKLAPGSYVLTAGDGRKPPARTDLVAVTGSVTTTGVRIVLGPGGVVVGHVFDDHRQPLEGVELRFDAVSSVVDTAAKTQSDAKGQYRLEGAPAGPFTLRAAKDGFRVRMLSGLRVSPGGTVTQDVTLRSADGGGLEYAGIGANLGNGPEGFSFASVFGGGPADRAGIRSGDRLVAIDGDTTDGMSVSDALQRLRGEAGTSVGLSVRHAKSTETVDVMVERGEVVR